MLQEQGLVVTEPDQEVWKKAAAPIYAEFENTIGKKKIESLIDAQQ